MFSFGKVQPPSSPFARGALLALLALGLVNCAGPSAREMADEMFDMMDDDVSAQGPAANTCVTCSQGLEAIAAEPISNGESPIVSTVGHAEVIVHAQSSCLSYPNFFVVFRMGEGWPWGAPTALTDLVIGSRSISASGGRIPVNGTEMMIFGDCNGAPLNGTFDVVAITRGD